MLRKSFYYQPLEIGWRGGSKLVEQNNRIFLNWERIYWTAGRDGRALQWSSESTESRSLLKYLLLISGNILFLFTGLPTQFVAWCKLIKIREWCRISRWKTRERPFQNIGALCMNLSRDIDWVSAPPNQCPSQHLKWSTHLIGWSSHIVQARPWGDTSSKTVVRTNVSSLCFSD